MSFMNLAVFNGADYRLLARAAGAEVHGRGRANVARMLGDNFAATQTPATRTVTGIFLLAALDAMRSHGNGGMIVALPSEPRHRDPALEWLDFGRHRVLDAVSLAGAYEDYLPRLKGAADPMQAAFRVGGLSGILTGSLEDTDLEMMKAAKLVGGLTAVDGAVVLSEELEILGFAATIRPPASVSHPASTICRCSYFELDPAPQGTEVEFSHLGGTRRQAAARLVAHNYDSVAITASHDGPLSLAVWLPAADGRPQARPFLITELEQMLA
jgi:hypothetical protein